MSITLVYPSEGRDFTRIISPLCPFFDNPRAIVSPVGAKVMSAKIRIEGDRLTAEQPVELFEGAYPNAFPIRAYDVAPDGRFLMIKTMDSAGWKELFEETYADHIRIRQNWFEELHELVPIDD